MERQKFEDIFKDVFEGAESAPSEKVWTNIELDLERQQGGQMKRRLLVFKLLAAASVVFALGIGTTGLYYYQSAQRSLTAANQAPVPNDPTARENAARDAQPATANDGSDRASDPVTRGPESGDIAHITPKTPSVASAPFSASPTPGRSANGTNAASQSSSSSDRQPAQRLLPGDASPQRSLAQAATTETPDENAGVLLAARDESTDPSPRSVTTLGEGRALPALTRKRTIELVIPKREPSAYDLMVARLEQEARKEKKSGSFDREKLWTSVGVAAGSFNNVSPGVSSPSFATTANTFRNYNSANASLANETKASGAAYSIGVNVGAKIASRWVLQGGLNYLTQSSAYTSDAVITDDFQTFTAATSAEFSKLQSASDAARVVPTAPYEVNNSLQFLSFPLQAGYLLLNKEVAIQISGGFSTDLFLQNTITPESGDLSKVTNGRTAESPYRPVNFSGLVGTEISYRFADRYRLSLNPGIRYPFNSIYKSEIGLNATPVTFDVGVRFRYIFQ